MGEMLEELPNDDLVVDRCLCAGVTFEELLGAMRAKGWDLERAQRETGCGETCRMCVPYLRMMVESGRVRFELDEHLRLD